MGMTRAYIHVLVMGPYCNIVDMFKDIYSYRKHYAFIDVIMCMPISELPEHIFICQLYDYIRVLWLFID